MRALVALLAVLLAACTQVPEAPPAPEAPPPVPAEPAPAPTVPAVPVPAATPSREIVVVPLDRDGLFGVRATYAIEATLATARAVILDFDRHAEFRPTMVESELLSREGNSALVRFTVPGLLGINLEVVCRNDLTEEPGRFLIRFRRESGSGMITELHGSFDVRAGPIDGFIGIVQEFYVAALVVDREDIARQHAEDARAIRDRIEAAHRGE